MKRPLSTVTVHAQKHATLFNRGQARHGFVVTCAVHRENHALAQVLQLLNHVRRQPGSNVGAAHVS
jgi:hypothetical protein